MPPTVEYASPGETAENALVDDLLTLYGTYGWWDDREADDLRDALSETEEVVVVRDDDDGAPLAAARVLTDYVYYAQVFDVVVQEDHRGDGLGHRLLRAVVEHPRLESVAPSLLAREGLVPFYESCGFEDPGPVEHPDGEAEPLRWLVDRSGRDGEE
ncbi:GNAT family N-acetyltransferase [Haloarchaeobius sp. HRN-SO-5]|uniref:GNAT family N-acetyltransferase n=1 Tax=Haloarchaeobius sp. HRN-SO-5 TaxID=3446118 RepID=UPI003EBE8290